VRSGNPRVKARTQECLAVSADGERWILLNASPEVRAQIEAFSPLVARTGRSSPIVAVALTNADLDHCLGVLSLREETPLRVLATGAVQGALRDGNSFFGALEHFEWQTLDATRGTTVLVAGLELLAVPVPGKPPRYLERSAVSKDEDNVALRVRDRATGACLVYAPSVGWVTPALRTLLDSAQCVFFDGTFWSSDELVARGISARRAEDMAHLPIGGPEGSLRELARLAAERRIYIHVNNTNPVLLEDSPPHTEVLAAGCEIACDGLEVRL